MSFVGLVPSERSSGHQRSQGSITKAGNGHLRRLLVEAAWHHQPIYRPGKVMRDRWELAPPAARQRRPAAKRGKRSRFVSWVISTAHFPSYSDRAAASVNGGLPALIASR